MKYIRTLYVIISTIIIVNSGCYKYPEMDYDYAAYNRLIGPEGGQITFYANYGSDVSLYENDSSNILVELNIPQGALDTSLVFNLYQYQNYDVANELSKGLAEVGSKFIYFVPIYESDGYHEHDDADLTYHLSVDFNKPVKVTYHYRSDYQLTTINQKKLQFEFYDWFNKNYGLYKIKIPEIDEWGQNRNIFVQWNTQGYPVGYNESDLKDIILGQWFPYSTGLTMYSSIVNWTEITDFTIDEDKQTVSFEIYNTDYMYILARKTEIPKENIPTRIRVHIQKYSSSQILRAAMIEQMYQIILEDGSIFYYDKASDFLYAEKFNVPILPAGIYLYLNNNYPSETIITNIMQVNPTDTLYKINLSNTNALLFIDNGPIVSYYGSTIYDYDENLVPSEIITFIQTNFYGSKINTITNIDKNGISRINIYLTYNGKNLKLYFDGNNALDKIIYYGLKTDDITSAVYEYLNNNFNNIDIVEVSKTAKTDSNYYFIELINNAEISIMEEGDLMTVSTYILSSDLPTDVSTTLSSTFNSSTIVFCYYSYNFGEETFGIQYKEGLYVEIKPSGEITYAGGNNFYDLPQNVQDYLSSQQNSFSNFDYTYTDAYSPAGYYYLVTMSTEEIIFDSNGNYITTIPTKSNYKHTKLWERQSTNPMLN